jgi:hypothetical protein
MFRTALLAAALFPAAVPIAAQSRDLVGQLLAGFVRIDADRDGVISRDAYRAVQAARWPQIDRGGDGVLTRAEIAAHAS